MVSANRIAQFLALSYLDKANLFCKSFSELVGTGIVVSFFILFFRKTNLFLIPNYLLFVSTAYFALLETASLELLALLEKIPAALVLSTLCNYVGLEA